MCGKEIRSEWELWWWEAGRRKGHRGMKQNGTVLCSLEFHKGLPGPQSVSRESPRVVAGMVCWSFPVSPVTMVLGRLHHSMSVERKGFFLFLSKTPSPLKKICKVTCQDGSYTAPDPRTIMKWSVFNH